MPGFHCFNARFHYFNARERYFQFFQRAHSFPRSHSFRGLVPVIVLTPSSFSLGFDIFLSLAFLLFPAQRHATFIHLMRCRIRVIGTPPEQNLHLEDHAELFPVCGESIGLCLPPPAILLPTY